MILPSVEPGACVHLADVVFYQVIVVAAVAAVVAAVVAAAVAAAAETASPD